MKNFKDSFFVNRGLSEDRPFSITTKNKMGFMYTQINKVTQTFIDYSLEKRRDVIDIGCAYGIAIMPIIEDKKCDTKIVAMDICKEHLDFIKNNVNNDSLENLTLIQGKFPTDFKGTINNSVDAIHCSQVFHFLTGDEIIEGLKKCFDCLKPGGLVFINTVSVHYCSFVKYLETYLQRKKRGDKWPGLIDNVIELVHSDSIPYMPNDGHFHLFDKDDFSIIFKNIGFNILSSDYYELSNHPEHASNGKGIIGVIAQKPL